MFRKTLAKKYHRLASHLLSRLVTTKGIFASTDKGWRGSFHSLFGRDSAITASLIFSAETIGRHEHLSRRAYRGLIYLKKWQGKKDDQTTGEELGKLAHEVRTAKSQNQQTLNRLREFSRIWFLDPKDHLLKNWDSVDSTPLWIISVARWHDQQQISYRPEILESMQLGLKWCLVNLKEYDGLAGFIGADLCKERVTEGLHNQGWKDNNGAYQYADSALAKHPIKDVFASALFWAALKYGAAVFSDRDLSFGAQLLEAANALKIRFNDMHQGLLMIDKPTGLHYYAEALDGDNNQLRSISADTALCLWAYYDNECIIESEYIDDVVKRVMMPDMLSPEAGIRNYSSSTIVPRLYAGGYHRSAYTFWPFVSGLIVNGLDHFGYTQEATQVAQAALSGISHFDSCIEMFLEITPHKFESWHNVVNQQQSSRDQAWTAAAAYYITTYLQVFAE